jgi:hypothetical protein
MELVQDLSCLDILVQSLQKLRTKTRYTQNRTETDQRQC